MSTAPFPHTSGPVPVPSSTLPLTLSVGVNPSRLPDLTIHRVTKTHHGRTLLMLGHAAEYLADSRRFLFNEPVPDADDEAIRILMRLSRSVFEEYAGIVSGKGRLEELMIGCVARLANRSAVSKN
jgi:hypothetical protein